MGLVRNIWITCGKCKMLQLTLPISQMLKLEKTSFLLTKRRESNAIEPTRYFKNLAHISRFFQNIFINNYNYYLYTVKIIPLPALFTWHSTLKLHQCKTKVSHLENCWNMKVLCFKGTLMQKPIAVQTLRWWHLLRSSPLVQCYPINRETWIIYSCLK